MAHPNLAELLSLRDGESATVAVGAHVEGCASCRTELARLEALRAGLRALPPVPPGPELWARVIAAVEPSITIATHRSQVRLMVAGLAASVALAVGLSLVALQGVPVPGADAGLVEGGPTIGNLKERSQRLEAVLAALESRPRVTTARSAGAIAELEDGIALVDYRLGQSDPALESAAVQRALWKKRVELMESLVTVRYSGERADSI